MAAVLAAGDGARLAGWSGMTHCGVLPEAGRNVDLAVPARRHTHLPGLSVVRCDPLPGEVVLVDGIPSHSIARLLLDLARRDDDEILEWAWRQAIYTKQLDLREISRTLRAHHGRPGTPALRALYERRRTLAGELRNRFEVLTLGIIREAGLPEPLCNTAWEVAPGLVLKPDFRIPELRLVVESDGRDGHEDVEFLLSDDERDALYAANGHATERFTYWQVKRERARVIAQLRRHLPDARAAGW
ncbi:endonuclease domain-containing protein [Paraconexibacter antarcticus]|uniref:Endonuclease domain-containing protein n=1 Tax=Paraconexibacter antarcticus TaxID=2949664 RepID=A0ABY5DWW7_9ACTN|nr:endonuclease domain-containing protein [Paraconexibacter antarcticus]UTI65788.1 endonuclease domain-containing protein [Paraconexibacter antarcticus]